MSVVGLAGLVRDDQDGTAAHATQATGKTCVANPINAVVVTAWAGRA